MSKVKTAKKLFFGKTILIASVLTLVITILIVYATGLASHRTIIENSFISLTILCVALFTFVSTGLYNGFNVYDDLSHKLKFKWRGSSLSEGFDFAPEMPDAFDGDDACAGILLSVVLWIVATIGILLFLIFAEFLLSIAWVALVAMIYWVIIRALKLVFSKSQPVRVICQRVFTTDFLTQPCTSAGFTVLFICLRLYKLFLTLLLSLAGLTINKLHSEKKIGIRSRMRGSLPPTVVPMTVYIQFTGSC